MGGVLAGKGLLTFATADLTPTTGQAAAGKAAGAPQGLTPAVAIVFRADDNNAATISYGMGGNASAGLSAGETDSYDFPPGYYADLSQICVNGTTGDILHVRYWILESIPGIE